MQRPTGGEAPEPFLNTLASGARGRHSYAQDRGRLRIYVSLRDLGLPLAQDATALQVLGALRGVRVDVRGRGTAPVSGRVLNVMPRRPTSVSSDETSRDELSLVTDSGDIVTIEITPTTHVRVADAAARQEVARYLALTANGGQRGQRRVLISTTGTGRRQMLVGYVAEAPVWKSTYRLIFSPNKPPLLQGWAVVDNISASDWNNVELSLVSGAPQTFKQSLSVPILASRPNVAVSVPRGLVPQTHDGALFEGGRQADAPVEAPSAIRAEAGTEVGPTARRGGGRVGDGVMGGVTGGVVGGPDAAPPPPPAAQRIGGRLEERADPRTAPVQAMAGGSDLGDLFEYHLHDKVTIGRDQSALVPIVQAPIGAERVSLWNASMGTRPRRAIRLTNTSALTLDGGSISIVDQGAFAGEGLIEGLKPGEQRFVTYAADLSVLVSAHIRPVPSRTTRVQIVNGTLTQTTAERREQSYAIRNNDRDARVVVIEQPVHAGWELDTTLRPDETTPTVHRFRVSVPAGATETVRLDEVRQGQTIQAVGNFGHDGFVSLGADAAAYRARLQPLMAPLVAKRAEADRLNEQRAQTESEIQAITADQQRVRQNMAALKGSPAERRLIERYSNRLDQQESRMEALRRERTEREAELQRVGNELATLIASLSFDEIF